MVLPMIGTAISIGDGWYRGGSSHIRWTRWMVKQPWLDIPPLWHRLQLLILMVAWLMIALPTASELVTQLWRNIPPWWRQPSKYQCFFLDGAIRLQPRLFSAILI